MSEEGMVEHLKEQSHRGYIAYNILVHELLMAVIDATRREPIHREQLVHMILVGMAKAAGELA